MSEQENNTAWIETPLSKFGYKCVMNKHDSCSETSCECLCHASTVNLSQEKVDSPLELTENVIWLSS